jgi:DNA-binding protein HU-beta
MKRWREANPEVTGLTNAKWSKLYNSIFDIIHHVVMAEGKDVRVPSLGTFKQNKVEESHRRNPKTGEKLIVPATTTLSFKATKGVGSEKSAASNDGLEEGMTELVEHVAFPPAN